MGTRDCLIARSPVYSTVATQDSLLLNERVWLMIYRERDAFAYTCKSESVPGFSVSSLAFAVAEADAMSWRNASRVSFHYVLVILLDGQSVLKMSGISIRNSFCFSEGESDIPHMKIERIGSSLPKHKRSFPLHFSGGIFEPNVPHGRQPLSRLFPQSCLSHLLYTGRLWNRPPRPGSAFCPQYARALQSFR
jgi:hypothetical protein